MTDLFVCTLSVGHIGDHLFQPEQFVPWWYCRAPKSEVYRGALVDHPLIKQIRSQWDDLNAPELSPVDAEHSHRCPDCSVEWAHAMADCDQLGEARAICPACEDNYLDKEWEDDREN